MIETSLFNGIIDKAAFNALSTPEKIKSCLQNDVFYLGNYWTRDIKEFQCVDYQDIDLEKYRNEEFKLDGKYQSNGKWIGLNVIFSEEINKVIYSSIATMAMHDDIDFSLSLVEEKKEAIYLLNTEIKKIGIFNLEHLMVEYNWAKELTVHNDSDFDLTLKSIDFQLDWIFGDVSPAYVSMSNYPRLNNFVKDYQKFVRCKYCLGKIQEIKNIDEPKNKSGYSVYEATYILKKTGLLKILSKNACLTDEVAFTLVGKILGVHWKTVQGKHYLINSEKIPTIYKKSIEKIDKVLNQI